jgi:hypothetical protein
VRGQMAVAIHRRVGWALLCAGIGLLVLASAGGAAGRVGVGKMTVTPTRVPAGSTTDLSFSFVADSRALKGTTLVDVPRGWSKPQQTNTSGPGYVELQPSGCAGTRIAGIAVRRIVIATKCPRRHLFRLLYHRATVPLLSSDGYVFLTQTRPANARKKTPFKPLGPRKQPVVRVRGAAATGLFMTVTSVATAGVPFSATVRAVDQFGNNAADYTGTVTLSSTDSAATLPASYAYGSTDASQHTFTGLVLRTPGTQRIRATDSHGFTIESGPITVSPFAS